MVITSIHMARRFLSCSAAMYMQFKPGGTALNEGILVHPTVRANHSPDWNLSAQCPTYAERYSCAAREGTSFLFCTWPWTCLL